MLNAFRHPCAEPITAPTAAPAATPEPTAPAAPVPEPEPTCEDSAIRLVDRGEGIHGAIVDDVLHLGGATAPATCREPTATDNNALRTVTGDDPRAAQSQEAEPDYFLLVVKYESGNRLYVVRTQPDGTACIVNTNDECIAQVRRLPSGFDLTDLPDDVPETIPAGQAEEPEEPAPAPPPAPAAPTSIPTVAGTYEGTTEYRLTWKRKRAPSRRPSFAGGMR